MKKVLWILVFSFMFSLSVGFVNAQSAGNVLQFNGSNYVIVNNPSGLPIGNSPRTIEAWIRPTASTNMWGLVHYGTGDCNGRMSGLGVREVGIDNQVVFWSGCADYVSGLTVQLNVWSHIAVTFDGTTATTYLNGVAESSGPLSVDTWSSHLFIGAETVNNGASFRSYYTGEIDEVRVWDVARTPTQIQSTMNTSIIGPMPNLVAAWNFDNISGVLVPDVTTHGNDGTIVGGALPVPSTNTAVSATLTIPTVGEWAMIILTVSMLIGATVMIRRREAVSIIA